MNKKLDEVRVLELMAIIIVTALANIILICTKVAPYVNHLALFGFFKTLLSMGTIYFIVSCALFAVSIVATCYLFLYSDMSDMFSTESRITFCNTIRKITKVILAFFILAILIRICQNFTSYGFGWQLLFGLQNHIRLFGIGFCLEIIMNMVLPKPIEYSDVQKEVYRKLYKHSVEMMEGTTEMFKKKETTDEKESVQNPANNG